VAVYASDNPSQLLVSHFMIAGIASLVFIPLLAIGFAHLVWAFGSTWPVRSEDLLVRTVIGRPGRTRMPRLLSALIAVGVLAAGVIALSLADPAVGPVILTLGGALAVLFLVRGVAGYTSAWRQRTPVEPFRSMDRKVYSPLCLALGAGFVFLVLWRFA
jgi:hypothetical protein